MAAVLDATLLPIVLSCNPRFSDPEKNMKNLRSSLCLLALAYLICLFDPANASAQDDSTDPCCCNKLTRSLPECAFVQSGLHIFEATQDNMPAEAYLPARAQASEAPAESVDAREMTVVIQESWRLAHRRQS
jgi:hypothetical protein